MITLAPYYVGPYLITPHPRAPHFDSPIEGAKYLPQVVSELSSSSGTNREGFQLIRELALTSLFFFINGLLKANGPYEALSDSLSLDMCNFRQSEACERPGAMAAAFMPRGFSKSRVFNHGGITWDLLRNPNELVFIVNAVDDKAHAFLHQIQRNFDSNEAVKEFFPEYIPGKNGGQSTSDFLILPNKTNSSVEPSVKAIGITGAAEGGHYTLIMLDDLVGLDDLDQNHQSNAQMMTAKKWLNTNKYALRVTKESRELVCATRYAVDDCYQPIYSSCRSISGWTKGDLQPREGGEWDIYYRLVEEDGVYLRPDVMGKEELAKLIKDDFWSAMTQYYNSPTKAGLAEFVGMTVKDCAVHEDEERRLWIRHIDPNHLDAEDPVEISLESCDVIVTTDLAATDTNMSAKTCRSAIEVWAKDAYERAYLLWSKVGYYSIFQSMDYIFEANRLYQGYIRTTLIEGNAFQKIIRPLLEREREARKQYINVTEVMAKGDKKARIRSAWGLYLMRERVYATAEAATPILEELGLFPMSDTRLDALDAGEKALVYTNRPESIEERDQREYEEAEEAHYAISATGY